MSLATRCAACGTVFRVVQDQLKVSEGWVRCGRCNEVFNALEGLFDLARESPPDLVEGTSPMPNRPPAAPNDRPAVDDADGPVVERDQARLAGTWPAVAAAAAAGENADERESSDARFPPDMEASEGAEPVRPQTASFTPPSASPLTPPHMPPLMPPLAPPLDKPTAVSDADPAAPTATPDFIRRAGQRGRWPSGRATGVQAGAALLLALALCAQVVHRQRDALAATGGVGAASLSRWCQWLGCTIELPRRIEDVAIESSALTPIAGSDALHMSVVLRNRGSTDVAQPWIDMSLTDPNGQLIARRALAPRDFRAALADAGIRPGAEKALGLSFTTGDGRVGGYTVEVFYP